jgi:hypothetical protein
MMSRDAGGNNHQNADEHPAVMTDDLAWAESITLRLADSYVPEVANGLLPESIVRKHRAA